MFLKYPNFICELVAWTLFNQSTRELLYVVHSHPIILNVTLSFIKIGNSSFIVWFCEFYSPLMAFLLNIFLIETCG